MKTAAWGTTNTGPMLGIGTEIKILKTIQNVNIGMMNSEASTSIEEIKFVEKKLFWNTVYL